MVQYTFDIVRFDQQSNGFLQNTSQWILHTHLLWYQMSWLNPLVILFALVNSLTTPKRVTMYSAHTHWLWYPISWLNPLVILFALANSLTVFIKAHHNITSGLGHDSRYQSRPLIIQCGSGTNQAKSSGHVTPRAEESGKWSPVPRGCTDMSVSWQDYRRREHGWTDPHLNERNSENVYVWDYTVEEGLKYLICTTVGTWNALNLGFDVKKTLYLLSNIII